MGAALREFLLEGFWVAGRGGRGVGGCAGGAAARGRGGACLVEVAGDVGTAAGSGCGDRTDGGGVGGRLVGVSAVADVGAAVVLAAVPVPASALVAVRAPAVVALVAAVLVAAVKRPEFFSGVRVQRVLGPGGECRRLRLPWGCGSPGPRAGGLCSTSGPTPSWPVRRPRWTPTGVWNG